MTEPLLLLHPLGMSARVWDPLVPGLAAHHDVIAPTMLGHRGGAPATRRPIAVADLVADVERALDTAGVERAHVAGNSLGGWVAIELARRGRALSVCAFSPAGSWHAGTAEQAHGVRSIRRSLRAARAGWALHLSGAMRARAVRRFVFRDVAGHGDRLSPARGRDAIEDLLGCAVLEDVLRTSEELAPLDPVPCPVTLAWSVKDDILPLSVSGLIARARIPGATFYVLPGVGHVPMIDDPDLVLATILHATVGRAWATATP